jgi:nucleoid-associated protein YgaU
MPRVPPLEPERPSTPQVEAPPTQPNDAPPPVKVTDASPAPAKLSVPPAPFSSRTHVVQANETLSSIAIAAYGNANYWPAIVKANPGIDPNRMKVGATIKLPELKDIKSAEPQNASARVGPTAAAVTIDPTRQYRVESGDNLHNIALKLYGKSTLGDKIYELNKQTIGPDPARLKIGQVLQLPEPPSGSASR